MSKTRATDMLTKAGLAFSVHRYDYDPNANSIGLQAAHALGESPERVLKTLMAAVDGKPVCVIVPSDREVSMKKLAAAFGAKSAEMMKPADAERITGYKVGASARSARSAGRRRRSRRAPSRTRWSTSTPASAACRSAWPRGQHRRSCRRSARRWSPIEPHARERITS